MPKRGHGHFSSISDRGAVPTAPLLCIHDSDDLLSRRMRGHRCHMAHPASASGVGSRSVQDTFHTQDTS